MWLKVLQHNTAGIQAYEGAGFKPVGQLRRCDYWLGTECDEIIMDAVADEFPGPSVGLPNSLQLRDQVDVLPVRSDGDPPVAS